MSSAFSQIDEKGALTGGPDAHALEAPVPSRLLKAKEFAAVLGIDLRHLRRLQKLGHVAPIKRPGSCRIVGYSLEEVARIVTSRVKAGKGYDREVADEFGYGPFLAAVTAAAELEQTRSSPQRFGELRHELMLDVLVFGNESQLAQAMGLTAVEIDGFRTMGTATLGQLFREIPNVRQAVARQIEAGLIALGIRRGQGATRGRLTKPIVFPVACGNAGGGSGESSSVKQNQRPRSQPARATGG